MSKKYGKFSAVRDLNLTIKEGELFSLLGAGLELTIDIFPAILVTAVTSLLFVGFGLLFGSIMNEKAVGGICGALLTNVAGWLSGVFVPLDLIGGAFKKAADILPFYHSVQAIKASLSGNFAGMIPHLIVVLGYSVVVFALAVVVFQRKMRGDKA